MFKKCMEFLLVLIMISGSVSAQNKSLVIMDFEVNGIPSEEAKVFTEHLQVELFNRNLFTILEMPDIQKKLAERDFSMEKCSSAPCLTKAGKLSGTDLIIGGSITKIEDNFAVTVRMIDVKNKDVIKMFVYQHSGNIISLLSVGVETVADRLSEPFKKHEEKPVFAHNGGTPANDSKYTHSQPKTVSNPGGLGPALASCLIGPRVGLEMNEGNNEIHLSEWIALGGLIVGGSAKWPFTVAGNMIANGTRAYMAYDRGGINNSFEGALAGFFLGPRVGNELHYRKIRTNEWLQLCCIGKILITIEAYEGKTMSEIEIEEGLRK
ncbi:MAG: hypothetical protein Q7J65_06715 [Candidatus Marinimicrobia bacterium]|nr:hypothetical protein [Candidatus Neomarinimicrobiota bacterium]